MGNIPHIKADLVPEDWHIQHVGSQAGLPHIWWQTPQGVRLTVGLIASYPKKWRELLLHEGKTQEQADAIIDGLARLKE